MNRCQVTFLGHRIPLMKRCQVTFLGPRIPLMKRCQVTFLGLGLLLVGVRPAAAEVVPLSAVRAKALERRPELTQAAAQVDEAEARIQGARSATNLNLYGAVEASVAPGGELVELTGADGSPIVVQGARTLDRGVDALAPNPRLSAVVGGTWNLYDFGRTAASERAARAEYQARRAEVAKTKASLLAAVDAAYLEWLAAAEHAKLHQRTTVFLEVRRSSAKAQVDAGAIAAPILLAIETDLAAAELRAAYADQAAQRARLAVASIAGALADTADPDPALLDLPRPDVPSEEAFEQAALAARIEAAKAEEDLHDRADRPTLEASAQLGVRTQIDQVFPLYRGTLLLSFPFWDGGASAARADAARAKVRGLEARRTQANEAHERLRARLDLDLSQAELRVELARRFQSVAQRRQEDAEARLKQDAATEDEVARAREALIRAEGELLTARVDRAAAILGRDR